MVNRDGDLWQKTVSELPLEEQIDRLAYAGFSGILVDIRGYKQEDVNIIPDLTNILHNEPIVSADNKYYFFDMTEYVLYLRKKIGDAKWNERVIGTLNPEFIRLGGDKVKINWGFLYEYDTEILFGEGGNAQRYLLGGWDRYDTCAQWTDGKNAALAIQLQSTDLDHSLTINAMPWLGWGAIAQQRVIVTANGHHVGEWVFDQQETQEKSMVIPHAVLDGDIQTISFELPDSKSPKDLGINVDPRELGIMVHSLVLSCPDKYVCGTPNRST